MTSQAALIERLRQLLSGEASVREVSMFGGRSFLVDDKLVVCARKPGDLLVRVDPERHDALVDRPGAAQAQMGRGRDMGPSWLDVAADAIASDDALSFWVGVALEYNRKIVAG